MSFILFWSLRVDDFPVGEGKEGPAFAESDEDVSLCNEVVESLHEIFGDEISPSLLVVGILHDWSQDLIAHGVHVLEDILGDLDEDDVVLEVLLVEFFSADPQDDEACVDAWLLFRLYLSTEGVSVARETWSVPVENA
jgi:hypothetical protein